MPAHSGAPAGTQPKLTLNVPRDTYLHERDRGAPLSGEGCGRTLAVQKRPLEISSPAGADEKEADEVARKVVNGQSAEIRVTGGTVNMSGDGAAVAAPEFQSLLEGNKGAGHSLDDSTRAEMESKMGADFRDVRVHTGSAAHMLSEGTNAQAFTHGQDIYFDRGNYAPHTAAGKALLAHELAHTLQQ